jgi:hypothetical protein
VHTIPGAAKKLTTDWLVQTLGVAMIGLIGWIVKELGDVSRALAVTATKLDDHHRRLEAVETVTHAPRTRP